MPIRRHARARLRAYISTSLFGIVIAAAGCADANTPIAPVDAKASSVPGNLPPTLAPTWSPDTVYEGDYVLFQANHTDPNHDIVTISWDWQNDGTFDTSNTTDTALHVFRHRDVNDVVVRADDGHAGIVSTTLHVLVLNRPPSITFFTPGSNGPGPITFSAMWSDQGDVPFNYQINWGDGTPKTNGSSSSRADTSLAVPHTFPHAGPYRVVLIVDDGDQADTSTITGFKPLDPAPTALITAPTSSVEGQTVAFTSTGSGDDGGQKVTYEWDFGDGTISKVANPKHKYLQRDTYHVTLRVTDSSHKVSTDTTHVDVANGAPTARFSAPDSVLQGSSYTLKLKNGTDANVNDTINIRYAFDCDGSGTWSAWSSSSSIVCPPLYDPSIPSVTPRGKITDGMDETVYTGAFFVADLPPDLKWDGVSAGPTVQNGAPFLITFHVSDPGITDGVLIQINWQDGTPFEGNIGAGSGYDMPMAHVFKKAGVRPVTIRVIDEWGNFITKRINVTVIPQR